MPLRLSDIFDVANGHDLDLLDLDLSSPDEPTAVAYVSRTSKDNGVLAYVAPLDGVTPAAAGTLSLSVGGSVCATFLQPRPYYTAQNVRVLTPKCSMSDSELLWWAMCIWHNRYRFNYGRHANRTFRRLRLPSAAPPWINTSEVPDLTPLKEPAVRGAPDQLQVTGWRTFRLDSIFEVIRGRYVPAAQKRSGETPEVSATVQNNGIARYIDLAPEHPAHVISVARNGVAGTAFLQPRPFFATDDVHVLSPRSQADDAALLFVCAVIRLERYRFNYGRKWSLNKMRAWEILLPHDKRGGPDWASMSRYISGRDFSSGALDGDSAAPPPIGRQAVSLSRRHARRGDRVARPAPAGSL